MTTYMSPEQPPIPREALPPGWGLTAHCDGRFGYRYRAPPIDLVADRTAANQCHPTLGLNCCWELRCRYRLGDRSIADVIGCVSTRRAAADGLLECMQHIHDAGTLSGPAEVLAVLEDVSFSDFVPDCRTSP
ncbi:hypothetical protein AArcMg_0076 [Natrarchaeobaculum sulfurireducens]|uniref:Uncharacterized protein n=2 Tax=Natrarchaeobaculum sulfurireducens TaxID=2044521 RepID=A0A346PKR4_9EURY|nr:hypothetical protein AArc1_0077 [Natrarchaeobaculum sulfurireducens]AXR80109.1 hypothetical protein AArcMg_0076 [Natrarchaeobaculum sulfurireducens]